MRNPVVLRIYKGEQLFGVKQFLEDQIVLGRQAELQVTLNDEKVSIIHAAIESRDGGWYVCDLGSESGTYRNGQPILDGRVESGDILQIGDYKIEFYIGVPKPKAAPSAATPPTKGGETTVGVPAQSAAVSATVVPQVQTPIKVQEPAPAQLASSSAAQAPVQVPVDPFKIEPPPVYVSPSIGAAGEVVITPGVVSSTAKRKSAQAKKKSHKKKYAKTFAPPSKYQSFRDFVKPSKGTVVEVLVLWGERVINAFHFSQKAVITMGSHPDCDIVLPVMVSRQRKVPILRIDSRAIVLVTSELSGELIKGQQSTSFDDLRRQNRFIKDGRSAALVLEQGEMACIDLSDQVSVVIRYTSDSPKPIAAPLLDMTAAEITGVLMAAVMVFVIWIVNTLATPDPSLDGLDEEPERIIKLDIERKQVVQAPTPTPVPLPEPTPPPPVATPKPVPTPPPPVVKSTPIPKKVDETKPTQVKAQTPEPKADPGAASNAAPNRNKTGPRTLTSPKQGGAIKSSNAGGAQAQSQRKDLSKSGVLSVFGGGQNDRLDTSYSGAGALSGEADQATGRAGSTANRPGEGLGFAMKDTGRGGTGTAAAGVSGVNTRGRGGGVSGYGTGGLGDRKGVQIVPGGNEESFSGSIDKEAIRRVVQQNLRAIKTCYERELNRNPDLFGKIVIEWVIGEQGRVQSARVKSSDMSKTRVGECVRDIIRAARFPEPPTNEEVTVAYPFFFSN